MFAELSAIFGDGQSMGCANTARRRSSAPRPNHPRGQPWAARGGTATNPSTHGRRAPSTHSGGSAACGELRALPGWAQAALATPRQDTASPNPSPPAAFPGILCRRKPAPSLGPILHIPHPAGQPRGRLQHPLPTPPSPTGPPPLELKPQGRADTSQQMQILPRAPEVRPACAGEVPPCHPSPRGTEPPAGPRGRILPTPLPAGTVAPKAGAWPKTPGAAAQAGPALSHLSLSLLRRGSCPETQRCRRPGGRGPLCPSLGHSRGD